MNATDPTGEFLDLVLDIAGLAYDANEIRTEGLNLKNGATFAADVVLAIVPFAPSIGGVKVALKAADKTLDAAKALDKTGDVLKAADKVQDVKRLPKPGSTGGPGAGKRFSSKTKDSARAESPDCVFCGKKTTRTPGPDQSHIDHAKPKSRGGNNTSENAQNTCRTCNLKKGAKTTDEFLKSE